jgi:hypothetical protein
MITKIAADLLVVIHFAFIVFVIFGGLLVLKWGKASVLHLPCVLWGALIEFRGWICPLTPLEHHFREAAGGEGYSGGFINYYLMPIIYPEGLTEGIQIVLGVIVLAVNLCVYGLVLLKRANRE